MTGTCPPSEALKWENLAHKKIVHPNFFLGDAKRLTNNTLGIHLCNTKKIKKRNTPRNSVGENRCHFKKFYFLFKNIHPARSFPLIFRGVNGNKNRSNVATYLLLFQDSDKKFKPAFDQVFANRLSGVELYRESQNLPIHWKIQRSNEGHKCWNLSSDISKTSDSSPHNQTKLNFQQNGWKWIDFWPQNC